MIRPSENTPDELRTQLLQLGADCVSYRAGQVLQYGQQMPRGYFLLVEGCLSLTQSREGTPQEHYPAIEGPRLFPTLGTLDSPLTAAIVAETNVTLWFFSRYLCQPGSFVMSCLETLHRADNPLNKIWRDHVTAA